MQRRVRIMSGKERPSTVHGPTSSNSSSSKNVHRPRAKSAITLSSSMKGKNHITEESRKLSAKSIEAPPICQSNSAFKNQKTFLTQSDKDSYDSNDLHSETRSIDSDYCSWKDYNIDDGYRNVGLERDWAVESLGDYGELEEDDDDERFRIRFEELQRVVQSQVDVFASNKAQNCV